MIYSIEILDEVFYDIEEAVIYYDLRMNGLGMRFYSEFQDTIKLISHSPFVFNKRQKNYRQVRIKDFPYYIVYEIEDKKLSLADYFM